MKRLVIAALAITLIGVFAALPAGAKAPGANGRIVFAKFLPGRSSGDTLLYTANPDGSNQQQLLSVSSCCPAWSPDGSRIAVSYQTTDGRITTALLDPNGSNLDVKTIPDPTLNLGCSAWSPDGSRMLCSGWDDVNKSRPRGLFTVRVSDWGDVKQLTTNPNGAQGLNDDPADYSPDGSRVVFLREGPNGQNGLFVTGVDGGSPTQIATAATPDCCTASWSPDGSWILFTWLGSLEVVHPDGTAMHGITLRARCVHHSGRAVLAGVPVYQLRCHKGRFAQDPNMLYWVAYQPSWSPDGKKMLFSLAVRTSTTEARRGVYTANANGTGLRPVTKPVVVRWQSLDFPASTDWGPHPLSP